jgi:hypothetical protein
VHLPPTALSAPGYTALNAAERQLYDALPKPGIRAEGCQGSPDIEGVSGVVAALVCPITATSMSQPITFLKFTGAAELNAFLDTRAALITKPDGPCAEGAERNGTWGYGSTNTIGRLVCLQAASGRNAEIDWANPSQLVVASVQAPQLPTAYAWWASQDGTQFPS